VFENTEEKPSTITDDRSSIKVNKGGQFKPSDISENQNIQYFAGAENQISMSRFYNQRFSCDYQMAWYPFDIQRCDLVMSMKRAFAPFTKLVAEQVVYEGEQFLTKYEVKNVSMTVIEMRHSHAIFVEITLGRQLLSVIMNVFVPTLFLNIISYSTNFYKDSYFESVIAINLTSMLVLVALFVSVNESLPATSYIKMIDIWLIFNLIVPFILMIIHTYMDTLRPEEGDSVVLNPGVLSNSPVPSKWSSQEVSVTSAHDKRMLRLCHLLANVGIPVIAIIFITVFFIAGLIHSYSHM